MWTVIYPGVISNMAANLGPCAFDCLVYLSPELLELETLSGRDKAFLSGLFTAVISSLGNVIIKTPLFPIAPLRKKVAACIRRDATTSESDEDDMIGVRTVNKRMTQVSQAALGVSLIYMGVFGVFSIKDNEESICGISDGLSIGSGVSFISLGISYFWGAIRDD